MSCTIMFYNLENLYDTIDDPNTNDDEFTPSGAKRWTLKKYFQKLDNLSEVISTIGGSHGGFPAVVGLSEVENRTVLRDLAFRPRISGAKYKIVHYNSNDARGVDVALFYRPDKFKLIGSEPIPLVLRSGREYIGRDILAVWGKLEGELFCFYVCHFLSRRAGVSTTAGFRRAGAETVRDHAKEMTDRYPGLKVVVMGDMNDSPSDESLSQLLRARKSLSDVAVGEYFNPFWAYKEAGQGSSVCNGKWKMYDNIVLSHNLLPTTAGIKGLRLVKIDKRYWGEVFKRSFMLRKGRPKRSYIGNHFQNGYSDHLPVLIKLDKK